MILIADSGSTKTGWCIAGENGSTKFISTSGINPFFRNSADIADELRQKLLPETGDKIDKVHFYGAGVINAEKGDVVKNALLQLYPDAAIEVQSDLQAAARATLGTGKGIACILGTGSNSCFYNGNEITHHVPPLGFILGDEGSGAVLGKKLVADFLKGIMPEDIAEKFKFRFSFNYSEFLDAVYKKEKPNQFLAQFVPFIHENISEKYCEELVVSSFNEFVSRNLMKYPEYGELPLCFVGSVAFYFQEQLKKVLEKKRLQLKTVLKEPLNGLINFHIPKNE